MKEYEFRVALPEGRTERLDVYASRLGFLNRSRFKRIAMQFFQGEAPVKPSRKVKEGDCFRMCWEEERPFSLTPEKMDLDILYEDEDVLVLNKPSGLTVHPGNGRKEGTLVQGLLAHYEGLGESFPDEEVRPGIVHRLDKETSGVLVTAKSPKVLAFLSRQFEERRVEKIYRAFGKGVFRPASGRIHNFLIRDSRRRQCYRVSENRGKEAVTDYRVLRQYADAALLELRIHTGRTHQIRVHLKSLGHPVWGDPLYGNGAGSPRLMLHAFSLKIDLPRKKNCLFRAEMPAVFREMQEMREKGKGGNPEEEKEQSGK